MQIQIFIEENLYEYYQKVNGREENIYSLIDLSIDVTSDCPLCRMAGCAHFICYYRRIVVDEKGRTYTDFPIARFLCIHTYKTFSLLPFQLVPYCKYSIELIVSICELSFLMGFSIAKVLDYLVELGNYEPIYTSASHIQRLEKLVDGAQDKIFTARNYSEFEECGFKENRQGQRKKFIEFAREFECVKVTFTIKGPCGLGHDFYLCGGGYSKNAQFLFGRASQFRYRGS